MKFSKSHIAPVLACHPAEARRGTFLDFSQAIDGGKFLKYVIQMGNVAK